jgi:hypothetical protein
MFTDNNFKIIIRQNYGRKTNRGGLTRSIQIDNRIFHNTELLSFIPPLTYYTPCRYTKNQLSEIRD